MLVGPIEVLDLFGGPSPLGGGSRPQLEQRSLGSLHRGRGLFRRRDATLTLVGTTRRPRLGSGDLPYVRQRRLCRVDRDGLDQSNGLGTLLLFVGEVKLRPDWPAGVVRAHLGREPVPGGGRGRRNRRHPEGSRLVTSVGRPNDAGPQVQRPTLPMSAPFRRR